MEGIARDLHQAVGELETTAINDFQSRRRTLRRIDRLLQRISRALQQQQQQHHEDGIISEGTSRSVRVSTQQEGGDGPTLEDSALSDTSKSSSTSTITRTQSNLTPTSNNTKGTILQQDVFNDLIVLLVHLDPGDTEEIITLVSSILERAALLWTSQGKQLLPNIEHVMVMLQRVIDTIHLATTDPA